eukprot:6201924-Pleurochrysis_carterae.AAC.1
MHSKKKGKRTRSHDTDSQSTVARRDRHADKPTQVQEATSEMKRTTQADSINVRHLPCYPREIERDERPEVL